MSAVTWIIPVAAPDATAPAVAWQTLKDALQAHVVATTGLATERVVFAGQGKLARPAGDGAWCAIRITGDQQIGRAAIIQKDNPQPSAGAEILTTARAMQRCTATITIFPPFPVTDATEAHALLSNVVAATDLPGRRAALYTAGIGALKFDSIVALDAILGTTRFEARASVVFTFVTTSEVFETIGYIATVNAEVDTTSPVETFQFAVTL